MKIYSNAAVQNVYQAYGKNKTNKAQKSGEIGRQGFDIQISNRGKDYQFAIDKAKQTPDVRMDKINAIKQSMENGTYNVDKTKLAKSIYTAITTDEIG